MKHQHQETKERRRYQRSSHGNLCKGTGTRARGPRNSRPRVYIWEWLRQVTTDDSRYAHSSTRAKYTPPKNDMNQSPASARPEAMSSRDPSLRTVPVPPRYPCVALNPIRRNRGHGNASTLETITEQDVKGANRANHLSSSRKYGKVSHRNATRGGLSTQDRAGPAKLSAGRPRRKQNISTTRRNTDQGERAPHNDPRTGGPEGYKRSADGDRDSAHGPSTPGAPGIQELTKAAVLDICHKVLVGTRLRMLFSTKRGATHTWEGKVTHVFNTFVSVRWDEYAEQDLLLPVPASAEILVHELREVRAPVPVATALPQVFGSALNPGQSLAATQEHADNSVVSSLTNAALPRSTLRYTERLRLLWEDIGVEARSLKEWGRQTVVDHRPWRAVNQPTLVRETIEPPMRKARDVPVKQCGGGNVPLEAPRAKNHCRGMNPTPVPINGREQRCCDGCQSCAAAWRDLHWKEEAERIAKLMPRLHPAFPGKGEPTIGGQQVTEDVTEPSFGISSGTTTMCWRGEKGSIIRPPEPRIERNKGVLGTIVKNTINLAKVLELDFSGEAAEVISILLDSVEFEKHLKQGFRPQTRISRFMSHHKKPLEESGVIGEGAPRDFGTNYMPVFTVPKKDETLRLIQDGRHLNRWFDRPPQMNLPRIHDVIDTLMRNEFFAQCDAKSWFYQIPLCRDIQKYFGVVLGGGRGVLQYAVMQKIPMGFSWAPCIAQRISNVLVRGVGLAWVDNYLIVGKTTEEFDANRKTFLERIDPVTGCNVVVDNTELTPLRQGETLGIEVDLETKRYRMSAKWADKVATRGTPLTWTPRTFSQSMGGIIWCSHVTRRGLCMQPHLMSVLGDMMRKIALRQIKWDDEFEITNAAQIEMTDVVLHVGRNEWIQWHEKGAPDMDIWTDASDTHAAYLIIQNHEVIDALVRATRGEHIFLEELSIALDAVARAYELGATRARLFCDNAPAGGCIEKKVSTNFVANTRLRGMKPLPVDVHWVSTKYELADPYTRGVPLPEVPCATQDLPLYDAAMEKLELRTLGTHTFRQQRLMCVCEGSDICPRCHPTEYELRAQGTHTFKQPLECVMSETTTQTVI